VYVVLHHMLPHRLIWAGIDVGVLFRFGQEAVILFFLLSGFVVNYSHRKSADQSGGLYFFKRFSRIYIPLVFVYLVSYLLVCLKYSAIVPIDARGLLLNLFMLQDASALKPGVIVDPYMGNDPLWSLGYECWFYALYFPCWKWISDAHSRSKLVFLVSVASAIVYAVHPDFASRLLMYLGIWWAGVHMADLFIDRNAINLRGMAWPVCSLLAICMVDVFFMLMHSSGEALRFGFHPVLELRHHAFAFLAIMFAFAWRKIGWVGFELSISPFKVVAPISYAIYIGHHHLLVDATYFEFLGNRVVEYALYIFVLLVFAYFLERVVFTNLIFKLSAFMSASGSGFAVEK
jgi:peptidoglycan/LPS O-acetylase OafA/YrhL